jgi:hypothetical protein
LSKKSLTWLLIFLLLALSIIYAYAINKDKESFLYKDYGKFYNATQFFFQHKSIYTKTFIVEKTSSTSQTKTAVTQAGTLLNPPFFTLVMLPLGLFSYATSLWIWSIISLACGALSILILRKTLDTVTFSVNNTLALLLACFVYYPTFANIQFGQMALLLMPLVTGAWLAARNKNHIRSGILLGVAASLKPFFGLFIFYFIVRREWRALFCFLSAIIVCALLAALPLGLKIYGEYYHILQSVYWYSANWNTSLYGFLLRLFGSTEHNAALIALPWLAPKLFGLLTILILGIFCKFLLSNNLINDKIKTDLDFSIAIVTMLLLAPLSWLYYFPLLIIPMIVLLQTAKQQRMTLVYLLVCLSVVLSGIAQPYIPPLQITQQNVLSVFTLSSGYVAALLLLFYALFLVRRMLLSKSYHTGTLSLSALEWTSFYVVILLPSLFSILTIVNTTTIFGATCSPAIRFDHFGT